MLAWWKKSRKVKSNLILKEQLSFYFSGTLNNMTIIVKFLFEFWTEGENRSKIGKLAP